MVHILYNPLSGSGKGFDRAQALHELLRDRELNFCDIREIKDYAEFFVGIGEDDELVIAGGDGTLNKFINFTADLTYPKNLFYYAMGSGNDFRQDVAPAETGLIPLSEYVRNLPTVTVNGKSYRFLNGIGYGIDGYCCEVGDKLAKKSDKPINYAGIAIKGLLFHYKPTTATVTVDGVSKTYKKVWLAPTMNGRYYGGGMDIAPAQDRLNPDRTVSAVVLFGSGKLKTLLVFPSIFKGEHVKHTEMVAIASGHEVTVKFDRPVALQIDGELVLNVTEYTVRSAAKQQAQEPETATVTEA